MKWLLIVTSLLMVSLGAAGDSQVLSLDREIEGFLEEEYENDSLSIQFNEANSPVQEIAQSKIISAPQQDTMEEIGSDFVDVEDVSITPISTLDTIKKETAKSVQAIEINLKKVFAGAPVIYTVLFILSTVSVCVWLYSMMTIRTKDFVPRALMQQLKSQLVQNRFDEALDLCVKEKHFFCKILATGILSRKHGLSVMLDNMKAEGKRSTIGFWQRIGILNEIAVIAPMLGLLGTVLGMFYAFYDLNRSIESVSLLFDGLGVSVGTTVAGLLVAILSMILYSLSKYRLVKILANVENESQTFAVLIDSDVIAKKEP